MLLRTALATIAAAALTGAASLALAAVTTPPLLAASPASAPRPNMHEAMFQPARFVGPTIPLHIVPMRLNLDDHLGESPSACRLWDYWAAPPEPVELTWRQFDRPDMAAIQARLNPDPVSGQWDRID